MDHGRLFIANLSKGNRWDTDKANLLGSLLDDAVSIGRPGARQSAGIRTPDFYLFIDEFQNFSTDAFASILAEARKYASASRCRTNTLTQLSETDPQRYWVN